jgi:hypothetical protein
MEKPVRRTKAVPVQPQPPLIGLKDMWKEVDRVWSKSLIPILMIVIGVLFGTLFTKMSYVSDCLSMGQFRSGDVVFTCIRK